MTAEPPPATFTTYEALIATMRARRLRFTRRQLPSAQYLCSILDYDPLTGEIRWRQRSDVPASWNTKYAGKPAGTWIRGYLIIGINGVTYHAHRLIWKMVYDDEPLNVDHRDRDEGNNRLANLRACDLGQNQANKARYKNNKVGLKGVSRHREGRFQATIRHNNKQRYLGLFDTAEQAHAAYCAAAVRLHGEFARFE